MCIPRTTLPGGLRSQMAAKSWAKRARPRWSFDRDRIGPEGDRDGHSAFGGDARRERGSDPLVAQLVAEEADRARMQLRDARLAHLHHRRDVFELDPLEVVHLDDL